MLYFFTALALIGIGLTFNLVYDPGFLFDLIQNILNFFFPPPATTTTTTTVAPVIINRSCSKSITVSQLENCLAVKVLYPIRTYPPGPLINNIDLTTLPNDILSYLVDCGGPCGSISAVGQGSIQLNVFGVVPGNPLTTTGTAVTGCTQAGNLLSVSCTGVTATMVLVLAQRQSGGNFGGITSITTDMVTACRQVSLTHTT